MNAIRNILALLGLVAVVAVAMVFPKAWPYWERFQEFDPQAGQVYMEMMDKLMQSGNAAEATVWSVKVEEGLSFSMVEETMAVVANEHNFQNVGTLPFYKQVEAMTGKEHRKVVFYLLCDALVGAEMLEYSNSYSAYMPCRISLVENAKGELWLYTLNMDPMIYGGEPLPPELREKAIRVKEIILDIMNRAAKGAF